MFSEDVIYTQTNALYILIEEIQKKCRKKYKHRLDYSNGKIRTYREGL